jgi:NAD-dependent dihydropyrimidine dehydrogenase PreA subunit
MWRKIILTSLFALCFIVAHPKVSQHTADSIANLLNQREVVCDRTCPLFESENSNAGMVNTLFIDVLAIIGTAWLYSNYKKKYFIGIGLGIVILVTGSLFLRNKNSNQCIEYSDSKCNIVSVKQKQTKESNSGLSDFQQLDSTSAVSPSSASTDEFSTINSPVAIVSKPAPVKITDPNILDPLVAFALLALISIGIKYHSFVRFRGLFMLAGVIWFGFYRGGCDCMISSFQNLVLSIAGWNFNWYNWIWLGALVVSTYLFGRVWCGWLCHLGGIQDFLFRSPKLGILTSAKSQRYLRIVRYTVLAAWVLQLVLMQRNVFCQYDPFKSLFNLIFTDWISITLLFILLVSSVLIYRPFCRTICPVGVILGWVSLLPRARKMRIKAECVNCGLCSKGCAMHAIDKTTNKTIIDTENCISCGECATICRKGSIKNDVK